jgi:hypothetical protein
MATLSSTLSIASAAASLAFATSSSASACSLAAVSSDDVVGLVLSCAAFSASRW